jgi:hypothetical protein
VQGELRAKCQGVASQVPLEERELRRVRRVRDHRLASSSGAWAVQAPLRTLDEVLGEEVQAQEQKMRSLQGVRLETT